MTGGYVTAAMMILETALADLSSQDKRARTDAAKFFDTRDGARGWMCDLCCTVAGLDAVKIRERAASISAIQGGD